MGRATRAGSTLSTHVLDIGVGVPAAGVGVALATREGQPLGTATTDDDGRVGRLGPERLPAGDYTLRFDTAGYFGGRSSFYPEIVVTFTVRDGADHHHVPLLLSPYGYSTYRGS